MSPVTPHMQLRLGNGQPTCIVFEAGATHTGLESAKKLLDVAADAGADAIKFQMVHAQKLVPSPHTMFSYEVLINKTTGERKKIQESLQAILIRRELTHAEWHELIAHCHKRSILFFATATTVEDLDFLYNAGCDCVKIASGDINFHWFLRQAAKYPWYVQLDTGNATIGEVEEAVAVLEAANCRRIIINHCPSGYPARLDGINLRILESLRHLFSCPLAFSDHSPGADMDIAAVAMGVDLIEKTITLDRCAHGPEHIMSLEPQDTTHFVERIRLVEKALGTRRRTISPQERAQALVARRSIVAVTDIPEGTVITQEMLDYARPGDGLAAHLDWMVLGAKTLGNIKAGQKLCLGHVEAQTTHTQGRP